MINVKSIYREGDIVWYNSPLQKDGFDQETHMLCGRRPMLILAISKTGYKGVLSTSTVKEIQQIHLNSKWKDNEFNLSDNIVSDRDFGRLCDYVGTISEEALQNVKNNIVSMGISQYSKSVDVKTNIVKRFDGRILYLYESGKYIVVISQVNNMIEVIPLEEANEQNLEQEQCINVLGKVFIPNYNRYSKIPIPSSGFYEIKGYLNKRGLDFINWDLHDKFISTFKSLSDGYAQISKTSVQNKNNKNKIEEPSFDNWFIPIRNSSFLKGLSDKEAVIKALYQKPESFKTKAQYNYMHTMLKDSIDLAICPREVLLAIIESK